MFRQQPKYLFKGSPAVQQAFKQRWESLRTSPACQQYKGSSAVLTMSDIANKDTWLTPLESVLEQEVQLPPWIIGLFRMLSHKLSGRDGWVVMSALLARLDPGLEVQTLVVLQNVVLLQAYNIYRVDWRRREPSPHLWLMKNQTDSDLDAPMLLRLLQWQVQELVPLLKPDMWAIMANADAGELNLDNPNRSKHGVVAGSLSCDPAAV